MDQQEMEMVKANEGIAPADSEEWRWRKKSGGNAKWFVSIGPLCGEVVLKKHSKHLGGGF